MNKMLSITAWWRTTHPRQIITEEMLMFLWWIWLASIPIVTSLTAPCLLLPQTRLIIKRTGNWNELDKHPLNRMKVRIMWLSLRTTPSTNHNPSLMKTESLCLVKALKRDEPKAQWEQAITQPDDSEIRLLVSKSSFKILQITVISNSSRIL